MSALAGSQHADNHYPSNTSVSNDQPLNNEPSNHYTLTSESEHNRVSILENEPTTSSILSRRQMAYRSSPFPEYDTYTPDWTTIARKVIESEGLEESLLDIVPSLFGGAGGILNVRVVREPNCYTEARIRLTSLYLSRENVQQWISDFYKLYHAKLNGSEVEPGRVPNLTEDELSLLHEIQSDCQGSFRRIWEGLDRDTKAARWRSLSLWLLHNSPELMPEFLLVTATGRLKPNFDMVTQCFRYLEHHCLDKVGNWEKGPHTYRSILRRCMSPENWPIFFLPQFGVRLYLKHSSHAQIVDTYEIMRYSQHYMASGTALCFMHHFTEHRDVDRALMALEKVVLVGKSGATLDDESVMRHCCKLLTLDSVVDGPEGRNFKILPKLLEMGIRPKQIMMNIVLSNAFRSGNSQLGYDMLHFMKGQGFRLDVYTYMALLMDAVDRGDRGDVESLMDEIKRHDELRTHPHIVSKMFHAHYTFTAKRLDPRADPAEVFYSVLSMYNQLHDITPLKELSIIPPHYMPPSHGANTQPSLMALYIMIASYFRCQRRIEVAKRVYLKFRELVAQGHEVIAPLAETDHTYNEFLCALRISPEGLRPCVQIVEDMFHGCPSTDSGELPKRSIDHAKPTTRTWTILMSAFIFNRQPQAALKVKQMMDYHKVEYDSVTWNTIINGHVNTQNISETANAIRKMEAEGYKVDAYTMKSLRYLRDPERLWMEIDRLDKVDEGGGELVNSPPDQEDAVEDEMSDVLDERLGDLKKTMGKP